MSWIISQALMKGFENSHSLPEQAAESSEGTCSDGERSAPSKSSPMQRVYLSPDKMTAFSRLSRFGMMSVLLTADRGEAVLTSYLAASPARTSASPERGRDSKASDPACGAKWRESLARYDRDTSSWKTPQCSLFGGGARVIGDLAEMGYDCRWGIVSAADAGAPHKRERMWILADSDKDGFSTSADRGCLAPAVREKPEGEIGTLDFERAGCVSEAERNVADTESIEEREQADKAYSVATGGKTRDEFVHRGAYISDTDSERREEQHFPIISDGSGLTDRGSDEDAMADATHEREVRRIRGVGHAEESHDSGRSPEDGRGEWWSVEPDVGGTLNGVAEGLV